jgi:hypothetical protein
MHRTLTAVVPGTFRHVVSAVLLASTLATTTAHADTPAFDRPGIAFSTQTLPAGSMDWEQGLPDAVHDDDQGTQFTLYSAATRIRAGLTSRLEIQLADALYNRLQTHTAGVSSVQQGASDLTLAFKLAMPSSTQSITWALLSSVSLNTGRIPFANDRQQYQLAASVSVHLDGSRAAGLYASAIRAGNSNAWTLAPNFSFPLRASLGGYLEAGYTFGDHIDHVAVAGGGLQWMASDRVQLDIYALHGLSARSTDLQAGLGISVYIP